MICCNKALTKIFMILILPLVLYGCGGGSDGGIEGTGFDKVSGIAATGAPIKNTVVTLKSTDGTILTDTTDESGKFDFELNDSMQGPYLLKIEFNGDNFFSIAHEPGTTNIHPLSDIASRNFFRSKSRNIEDEFANNGQIINPPLVSEITDIVSTLRKLLLASFSEFTIENDFDLLHTAFDANNQGFDQLLDHLSVIIDNNNFSIQLRNIDPEREFESTIILNFDLSQNISQPDLQAPTPPQGLVVIPASNESIVLAWNSATDNIGIASYNVFKKEGTTLNLLKNTSFNVITDTGLTANTEYCYIVEAIDGSDNKSVKTAEVCATTLLTADNSSPATIAGLTATKDGPDSIALNWLVAQENDIIGYDVHRSDNGAASIKIATVIANNFTDSNLDSSINYCYTVKAFDAAGNRSANPSNESCLQIENAAPQTITASPSEGVFPSAQSVTLACDNQGNADCGTIYYTTDGSTPTVNSLQYNGSSITISSNTTLQYITAATINNSEPAKTEIYVIDDLAPTTSAEPATETFTSSQNASLICNDNGGSGCLTTYYTTDPNTAIEDYQVFNGAITIAETTTLYFYSKDTAGNIEDRKEKTYTININSLMPSSVAIPAGGISRDPQTITLACSGTSQTACENIYYTTDETTPIASFTPYNGPIQISANTKLRFFATSATANQETVQTQDYIIDSTPPTVSVNTPEGEYNTAQTITLNCIDDNAGCAEIYYTLDGTEPSTASTRYVNPFKITTETTLKFFALDNADNRSATKPQKYTFTAGELLLDVATNGQAVAGGRLLYTITVSNMSGTEKNNVHISFQIPPDIKFHGQVDVEPDVNCGSNCVNGIEAFWNLTTLAAGESRTIDINANVLAGVDSGTLITAPIRVNLIDTLRIDKTVAVYNNPMSELALSASKDGVLEGENVVYTLDVGNIHSRSLNNVALRLVLPEGVTIENNGGGDDTTSGEIHWDFAAIAVGNALQRQVTVVVPTNAKAGQILNARAELRHDEGLEIDAGTELPITVSTALDMPLSVEINSTENPAMSEKRLPYTITVSNLSETPVDSVNVFYRIPPEVKFHVSMRMYSQELTRVP